jgi:hypothetical protein
MQSASTPPRVFISYSWESDGHKDWVRNFAEQLSQNGVNVRLDQWHTGPGQSLKKERRGLQKGDNVKLQFEIAVRPDADLGDISRERMWVGH